MLGRQDVEGSARSKAEDGAAGGKELNGAQEDGTGAGMRGPIRDLFQGQVRMEGGYSSMG